MKKKLFISCPMKDRTEENIRKSMEKMHKIAEIVFDEELEVIPSYIEDHPSINNNQEIWYFGKTIQLLAEADFFIGINYTDVFKGCNIESDFARKYEIRSIYINAYETMPDLVEVKRNYWGLVEK